MADSRAAGLVLHCSRHTNGVRCIIDNPGLQQKSVKSSCLHVLVPQQIIRRKWISMEFLFVAWNNQSNNIKTDQKLMFLQEVNQINILLPFYLFLTILSHHYLLIYV